jgi:hypothetical protein
VDHQNPDTAVIQTELRVVREDISEIKSTIQSLSQAMLMLVRVEQQQNHQRDRLEEHTESLAAQAVRLARIEGDVPGLKELRAWVVRGVAALVFAIVAAILGGNLHIVVGPKAVSAVNATDATAATKPGGK